MSDEERIYYSVAEDGVLKFRCIGGKGSDSVSVQVRHSNLDGTENTEKIVEFSGTILRKLETEIIEPINADKLLTWPIHKNRWLAHSKETIHSSSC